MRTIFSLKNQKDREHMEDLGVDKRIILKRILWEKFWTVWSGYMIQDMGK
jgi:hypothetical protein